jgi:hypothetical protein
MIKIESGEYQTCLLRLKGLPNKQIAQKEQREKKLISGFCQIYILWRYLAIASISASGKDDCDRNSREMTAATMVRLTTEMAVRDTARTRDGGGGDTAKRERQGARD